VGVPPREARSSKSAALGEVDGGRAALTELRTRVAAIAVSQASSVKELDAARHAIREMSRQANLQIRSVDLRSASDQVAGHCFAARALVTEAQGQITAQGWKPAEALPRLVRARRALYRALCLVVRSLVEDAIARPSGFAPRGGTVGSRHPAATFVHLVGTMTATMPHEVGWSLEVAECELAITLMDRRVLDENRRKSLAKLHDESSAWASSGRDPVAGAALLALMREQADELERDILGPPTRR